MIDSASRTKPRAKAKIADSATMPMTARSSGFIVESLGRGREPARAGRLDRAPRCGREPRHQFAQMPDRNRRHTFAGPGDAPRRDPGLGETELCRLLEARLG